MIGLTTDPIEIEPAIDAARRGNTGAIVTFVGTVRDDGGVTGMEVEAYHDLALPDLEKIAADAIARYGLNYLHIMHRTGKLQVGETILLIVCSTAHRKEAFLACEEVLERIKERVPIWKRVYREGRSEWVPGHRE
jgi:molybdopterin synthase catalytic subunit